jgi:hypothetical protein
MSKYPKLHNFIFSLPILLFFIPILLTAENCDLGIENITDKSFIRIGNQENALIRVNGNRQKRALRRGVIRLRKGLNRVRLVERGKCRKTRSIIYAPNFFKRPYQNLKGLEDLFYTRIIENTKSSYKDTASAIDIAASVEEVVPSFEDDMDVGLVFLGQFIDHDLTANDQFQNGDSSGKERPINLRTPFLDLDHLYGYGPNTQPSFYENRLYFRLSEDGNDVVRENGIAQIVDSRDDITGLTLQVHIAFRKFHNAIVNKLLNGNSPNRLRGKLRNQIFEMARNEMIGSYQGIVYNEFSKALLGRSLNLNYPKITNIPVEFSAAVFRIGHTLVPNEVKINEAGDMLSPTSTDLRGENRIVVPWNLLVGTNAGKAGRFDAKIAPVMQKLFIPLAPQDLDGILMVGGSNQNLGSGKVVNGVLHLDLIETNILRGREQKLPSGEEVLAKISNFEYDEDIHGATDLFHFVLREAEKNNFKFGPVGAFVFEKTITGVLKDDKFSILKRKYSRRDRARFKKLNFSDIINAIQ